MRYTLLALAAAMTAFATEDDCQTKYSSCMSAQGATEVNCQCQMLSCSGEDSARLRDYCASATAGGQTQGPSATSYGGPQPYGSTSVTSASIITGTPGSQPSGQPPVNAPAGSLDLGATCSDKAQCKNGVDCYSSNSGLIRRCGNFNAACTSNAQCAYNTCNNGLCNGFISPSANATMTAGPTGTGAFPGSTSNPSGITPYEGKAPMSSIMSGFAAIFFGVVAWVL